MDARAPERTGDPFLTIDGVVPDSAPYSDEDAMREADEARRLRAEREAQLSPAERLERVHELCRQLAGLRLAER